MKVGKANNVRILIKLKEETPCETTKKGLFCRCPKPRGRRPRRTHPEPSKQLPGEVKKEEVQRSQRGKARPKLKPAEKESSWPKKNPKGSRKKKCLEKVYSGRRNSLDFKDADNRTSSA
jgi:hypothetical protein